MASIKVGDQVKNMVCINDNTPSGRIRMKCNICGYIGDYDKYNIASTKQPCRVCRHFGKYTFDHMEGTQRVVGYIENNNKVISWANKKENEDAMKLPLNTVVFKCGDCGKTFGLSLQELRSWGEVNCPFCHNKKKVISDRTKIEQKQPVKIAPNASKTKIEAPVGKIDKSKNLGDRLGKSAQYNISGVNIEDTKDELVGNTFGTLKVISAIVVKRDGNTEKTERVKCKCSICGMEEEYNRYKVKNLQATCKICKKMETKLYKGKNEQIRNMVGTITNGLKITGQKQNENGTWIGEYTCLNCKTKDKAALVKLSNKEVLCKKCMAGTGVKPIIMYCPNCGNKISVPYRMLYTSEYGTVCPQCKKKLDYKIERALLDDQGTFRNVLNNYTKLGLGLSDISTDSRLAKFGDVFINRKGERCYNCYCIEHRQELVLSESEIEEFDHKQCNCDNVEFYKLLNIPTKFKRKEKSIEDIFDEK